MGGFICNCEEGYEGVLCDMDIDECLGNMCTEQGTCVVSEGVCGGCVVRECESAWYVDLRACVVSGCDDVCCKPAVLWNLSSPPFPPPPRMSTWATGVSVLQTTLVDSVRSTFHSTSMSVTPVLVSMEHRAL